jgi:transposase
MKTLPDLSSLSHEEKDTLIISMFDIICRLEKTVKTLEQKVKNLESKQSTNSRNSSKPPSSDGYNKPAPKSQRPKTDKLSGGQPGHKGVTLELIENPDKEIFLPLNHCSNCGHSLDSVEMESHTCRQVFDLDDIKACVTAYLAEVKSCPNCNMKSTAQFPEGVSQKTQYGSQVCALVTYLNQYQLIPYKRLQELMFDVVGIPISQGSIYNILNRASNDLQEFEIELKNDLHRSPVVHFDESGFRIMKSLHWLHVSSTDRLTLYQAHKKRGREAIDSFGILPGFEGVAVHDGLKVYFSYDSSHALCNAHHLRELIFAHEQFEQEWAAQLIDCLVEAKIEIETCVMRGENCLPAKRVRYYRDLYSRILRNGCNNLPTLALESGSKKQHKIKNLHDRLVKYKKETLLYIDDFNVPFDNNLAERDFRMNKCKQKISGCFRSFEGAEMFCRIRSYILTGRKNSINAIQALVDLYSGKPFMPSDCI